MVGYDGEYAIKCGVSHVPVFDICKHLTLGRYLNVEVFKAAKSSHLAVSCAINPLSERADSAIYWKKKTPIKVALPRGCAGDVVQHTSIY